MTASAPLAPLSRRLRAGETIFMSWCGANDASIAEATAREDFDAAPSRLVIPGLNALTTPGVPTHFLRAVPLDEPALRSFETLNNSGKPRCGQVRDIQRDFLFGDEAALQQRRHYHAHCWRLP